MQPRITPLLICLALTSADCSWDAPPDSDFITSGAGESVARSEVGQAREIWPPASIDNDIVLDASRLLPPRTTGSGPPNLAGEVSFGGDSSEPAK